MPAGSVVPTSHTIDLLADLTKSIPRCREKSWLTAFLNMRIWQPSQHCGWTSFPGVDATVPRGGVCVTKPWIPAALWLFVPMECRVRDALWLLWLSHGRWYTFWIVPWTMCSGIPEVPVRRWTALSLAKLPGGVTWRCSAPQSPAFQSSQTDWRHESKWTLQRILAPTCLSFPSGRADILEHTQHVPAVSCPSSQFPQNLCAQWINW